MRYYLLVEFNIIKLLQVFETCLLQFLFTYYQYETVTAYFAKLGIGIYINLLLGFNGKIRLM